MTIDVGFLYKQTADAQAKAADFSADPANIINQVNYVTAGAYKKTFRNRRKEVRRVKVTETVGTIYTCRQDHRYLPYTELD
jgi:hypothetical protein